MMLALTERASLATIRVARRARLQGASVHHLLPHQAFGRMEGVLERA